MAVAKPDLTRVWAAGAPGGNVVDPDVTTPGKFDAGWVAEVPPFEHFNYLQKTFSQGLAHNNEQGINLWDADTVYPINGLTKGSDGEIYFAVIENNGNDPTSDDGTNWIRKIYNGIIPFETVADAQADSTLRAGLTINIAARASSNWILSSSGTANNRNVIFLTTSNLYATLINSAVMNAKALGAIGNDISSNTDLVEIADTLCSILIFPSQNGEIYRFGSTPTLSNITCVFESESACSNRTIQQVNGIVLNAGAFSGLLRCEEISGKRIEIVCGTIRQNASDRTKWDWIKDANHEPIGVDDSVQAVATGSELVINFTRTFSKVLSFVCGPDEDLANAGGAKIGASVGLSSATFKMSLDKHLAAAIQYTGSSTWGVTYGAGQGGTSDHNVNISSVTHDNATGITTITHDALPGYDVSVIPYSGGATLAGGVPHIPVLHSTNADYSSGTYETKIKWIDPATGAFVLTQNAPMACIFSKSFNSGVYLDGTFGTSVWDFDKGNIWFFGLMQV